MGILLDRIINHMEIGESLQLQRGLALHLSEQGREDEFRLMLSASRKETRPSDLEMEILAKALQKRIGRKARLGHEEEVVRGWFVRRLIVHGDIEEEYDIQMPLL